MMFRFSLYYLVTFLACALPAFPSPVPIDAEHQLEKRARSGHATYFEVGLGNCGKINKDSDWIVALALSTYGNGSHCNKKVTITDPKTHKKAVAMVRDSCQACGPNDLDMSPSLFEYFYPLGRGVFNINWSFD